MTTASAARILTFRWTPDAVERLERRTDERFELVEGQIFPRDQILNMAGGSPGHARIIANVLGILWPQLREGDCRTYASDLRVQVRATDAEVSYRLPDVTVVCGELQTLNDDDRIATNPTVVFEVVSPSTRETDYGDKLHDYLCIEGLRAYVIVDPEPRTVTVYEPNEAGGIDAFEHTTDPFPVPGTPAYLSVEDLLS